MSTKVPADQNPFASRYLDTLPYQFIDPAISLETLIARWEKMGYRAAIIGPCGRGKTTLLNDLEKCLLAAGHQTVRIKLFRGEWRFRQEQKEQIRHAIQRNSVLLLDGAEQLNWFYWKWLTHFEWPKSLKLLITSHSKWRLPKLYFAATSPKLLKSLVNRLMPSNDLTERDAITLLNRHRGNVRMALLQLYDRVSDYGIELHPSHSQRQIDRLD